MTTVFGPSKRTGRIHTGEFFEITITRPRGIFVRLGDMDGEIVCVPSVRRDALSRIPSGLDAFRILDRVTVALPEGRHVTTGEIHSVLFERAGCGKGIMIKDDDSTLSCWMPLPEGVTVTPAS